MSVSENESRERAELDKFGAWNESVAKVVSGFEPSQYHRRIGWIAGYEAAVQATRERIAKVIVDEIMTSTGPTGGWLDSPKAITAALVKAVRDAD